MANLNIREYDSNATLTASDRGPEALERGGRRVGSLYSEAAQSQTAEGRAIGSGIAEAGQAVSKYQDAQDISHGAVGFSGLFAAGVQDWNAMAKEAAEKNPYDPTVAQKFINEKLDPALEKFKSGFTTVAGQKWAEERINALRTHFTEKTIADMSDIAGHAARVGQIQTENTLSSAAASDATPKGIQFALDTLKTSVEGVAKSSNMTATDAAKFTEERLQAGSEKIVKAGVQAAIWKDPASADAITKDPRFMPYIDATEINQFRHMVDSAKKSDAANARLMAKQDQQDTSDKTSTQVLDNLRDPAVPSDQKITAKQIIELGPGGRGMLTKSNMEDMLRWHDKVASDGFVENATIGGLDILGKIRSGEVTEKSQVFAELGKTIDQHGADRAIKELEDRGDPLLKSIAISRAKFMQDRESQINPKDPTTLSTLPQNVGRMDSLEALAIQRESTMSPKDRWKLYDPREKEYLGNSLEARPVSPYELSLQSNANSLARNAALSQDPEKSGEKAANPYNDPKVKDGYFPDAKYDGTKGRWFVVRGGKKMFIED